ncbi:MAG: acetylglutamate kinase [Cryomorphaceae bacterium]
MQEKPVSVFKYGGNAMTDNGIKNEIVSILSEFADRGHSIVVVHGGGPFIKKALTDAEIESEFIDGHRKTTPEALLHVEKALKGEVNTDLVGRFNRKGQKAVGLSGKDGRAVTAVKRVHIGINDGEEKDLGQVGDVGKIDPTLIELLLKKKYIPILTCIAADENGDDYNINADMFAGHVAGALNAERFVVMTDVDGLLEDIEKPDSLMHEIKVARLAGLKESGIIVGGMLPKIEACEIALEKGAQQAIILNGTNPDQLRTLLNGKDTGTKIIRSD